MGKSTERNFALSDFFLESTYIDTTGRTLPCYLLSKMGCEMVANKLTGEKGVLFTAAYVAKFNEMERQERAELEARAEMPAPRLGEYNACARIFVRALKTIGATPEGIIAFLKGLYGRLGIIVAADVENETEAQYYTAKQIAEIVGLYSKSGFPHSQAVSCIINENLFISDNHINIVTLDCGGRLGFSTRYDSYALRMVKEWLADYGCPEEVYGFDRTYSVRYSQ
jgi:hypothetical protein